MNQQGRRGARAGRSTPRGRWRWWAGSLAAMCVGVGAVGVAGDEGAKDPKAAEAPGAIVGRILVRGTPAAGTVEVRAKTAAREGVFENGAPVATVKTDEKGAFRVDGLPAGTYEVRSVVAGMTPGYGGATVVGGLDVEVPVEVPGGAGRLAGHIVWEDGTPFRGVVERSPSWSVHREYAQTEGETYAETDAEGKFAFEGVAPGRARLTAIVPGSLRGPLREVRSPAEGLEFVLCPNSRALRGRVVDDAEGKPVAGALVSAGTWSYSSEARTDADGRFEMRAEERTEQVKVTAAGFATARIPLGYDQTEVPVRLTRGAVVVGRVTTEDGKPAAGVTVLSSLDAGDGEHEVHTSTSDAEGRYRLEGLAVGDPVVVAVAEGWVSEGIVPWTKSTEIALRVRLDPAAPATRDLKVVKAGAARVKVHDAQGRPVPFARVWVDPAGAYGSFWGDGALRSLRRRRANAEGIVEFPTLIPGTKHLVGASAQGFVTRAGIALQPGVGFVESLDVELALPRSADVSVLEDATSAPVAGAIVTAYSAAGGEYAGGGDRCLTDASGHVQVGPLPPGDIRLSVEADDFQPVGQVSLAAAGSTTVRVKPARTIGGRVIGPPGMDARAIEVRIQPVSTRRTGWGGPGQSFEVAAGERFRSRGLEGDECDVTASVRWRGRRYEGKARAAAGKDDLDVPLAPVPTHEVRLRVLDAAGKPVARAQVEVSGMSRGMREAGGGNAVVAGGYRAEVDSETREVAVEIRCAEDENGRPLALAATDVGPLVPGEETVEVRLKPERRVTGFVHDRAGKGVEGVVVGAYPLRPAGAAPDAMLGEYAHAEATTGKDGKFALGRLGDYGYQLRVKVPSDYAPPAPVNVSRTDKKSVDVKVEEGMRVMVRILDPAGKPLRDARVFLSWSDASFRRYAHEDNYAGWTPFDDGTVVFKGLLKGRRYDLEVRPPDSRKDLDRIRMNGWEPKDGDVRFEKAPRLTGIVKDNAGHPLPGFPVATRPVKGDPAWNVTTTDADGRFVFEVSAAKKVTVRPFAEAPTGDKEKGGKEVQNDATDVVLTVDARRMLRLACKPPSSATIRAYVGGGGAGGFASGEIRPGESAYFVDLDSQRDYAVYAGPAPDGGCFYREGVRPGGDPVDVACAPGIVVHGKTTGNPKAIGMVSVDAEAKGLHVKIDVADDGTFATPPLPEGTTWTIVASGLGFSGEQEVKVVAGATVDLKIR